MFKSYGVIYLFDRYGHISSTVCSLYFYPNYDTEMATFDLTVLHDIVVTDGRVDDQKLSYPYEPISVYYRLNEENPEVTCDPWLASYSLRYRSTRTCTFYLTHTNSSRAFN